MKRPLLIFILFVAGCSGSGSSKTSDSPQSFLQKALGKAIPVSVYAVASHDIPLTIKADGKTEVSDRFELKAPSPVKIQRIFVDEGARVQAGDMLIRFNDEESQLRLNLAHAEMREAEAGLEQTSFLDKNREQLLEEEKLSELEAQGLEGKINLYQATLDRARAELELYEKLSDTDQLSSPIAGVVTKKEVSEGASVAQDQDLMEIVKLDPILFVFSLPSNAATLLEQEKNPQITVRFASLPGQEFSGESILVGVEVKAETNGVEVKLRIPNPDLVLKAGLKGNVHLQLQAKKKVVTIPETAIIRSDRSVYVYKIEEKKLKKIPVDLSEADTNGALIVNKGLVEGDTIVAPVEDENLKDGTAVEIQPVRSDR